MRIVKWSAVAATGLLFALAWQARGADVRVNIQTVSPTFGGTSVVFGKGGRVGNWLSGTGNSVVMDATFPMGMAPHYLTNIFTFDPSTLAANLALISDPAQWTGPGIYGTPAVNYYVGNPWFCPGSPSNAYILFQAQNNHSLVNSFAQPGGGYDNDIWVYRPAVGSAPPKVWKLTDYGISGTPTPGTAVLGPQCSMDSSGNNLHIVYGHLTPGAPTSTCNTGNGPSNGHCWWFGQWDLTYGDVYFNGSGDPAVDPACSGCKEPGLVQSSIHHVNPRNDACNPICGMTGTASLSGSTLTVASISGGTLSTAVVGAGILLTTSSGPFYTLITCYNGYSGDYGGSCPSGSLTLALDVAPTGFTGNFTISNYVVYEPQLYVTAGQNIFFTSNRRPPYHDAVAVRYNLTTQVLQELNSASPPLVPGGAINSNPFANTFWNEFLTPDATFTHSIFMSDRATTSGANLGINPEFSDHFICTGLNCDNVVRLTYFDDNGLDATLSHCVPPGNCFPITAVRGAWSPGGTQYMTLIEYLVRGTVYGPPAAALYLYSLTFPNTEVSGQAVLSGNVRIGP